MMDLLDYVFIKSGCNYISDLPDPEYRLLIIRILEKIPSESYGIDQWNNLIHYIAHCKADFRSASEALEYLKKISPL